MIKNLSVGEFLSSGCSLIDVRSPGEFAESHISGAVNIPLLNDEHRALVGTLYKQEGRDAAIALGYKLVNPLRNEILEKLKKSVEGNKIRIYCARGGLRSANMAAFFGENGYEAEVLKGGYKSYRNLVHKTIASFRNILILSAYTGSGKTEVIKALAKRRAQVLDLEELANHKGSAFGALGRDKQPSTSEFHNRIFDVLYHLNPAEPLWIENESVTIGKVFLPKELWENMKQANGVEYQIPIEERLSFIMKEYGHFDLNDLAACVGNLSRRLGDEECRRLSGQVLAGELESVVRSLFRYYDKSYEYGRLKRKSQHYVKIYFSELNPDSMADFLLSRQDGFLSQSQ